MKFAMPSDRPGLGFKPATLLLMSMTAAALIACSNADSSKAGQAVARVNDREISVHQVDFMAQRLPQGMPTERITEARQVIVDRLIEQETLLQYATTNKIDRDAKVMQQLDSARRDILARAAIDQIGAQSPKPTAEEIRKFYDENPDLFAKRRIIKFDEVSLPAIPANWGKIEKDLAPVRTLAEATAVLKANAIEAPLVRGYSRAPESLPLQAVPLFAKKRVGDLVIWRQGQQVVIGQVTETKDVAVDLDKAQPFIEQFLTTRKRQEAIAAEVKRLNDSAKVAYLGEFADRKPREAAAAQSDAGQPPAAQAKDPAAPAAAAAVSATPGDAKPINDKALAKGVAGLK
jgi:EpsD family peptidyl-prolyl cis-trans isomerase